MSCHCNQSVRICEPVRPVCCPSQQCNPCCEDDCSRRHDCSDKYCKSKRSHKTERKHKRDNRESKDHRKRDCNKCYRRECDCIEYYPYLRVKCGCASATIAVQAAPEVYTAAGQVITYTYTITNTGTVPITGPLQICDSRLGGQIIPCTLICPSQSVSFTRTYTILPQDLQSAEIISMATAYIQIKKHKGIVTCPAVVMVTRGDA